MLGQRCIISCRVSFHWCNVWKTQRQTADQWLLGKRTWDWQENGDSQVWNWMVVMVVQLYKLLKVIESDICFRILGNLYTQCETRICNPKIKSHMLHQQSQPGIPELYTCDGRTVELILYTLRKPLKMCHWPNFSKPSKLIPRLWV